MLRGQEGARHRAESRLSIESVQFNISSFFCDLGPSLESSATLITVRNTPEWRLATRLEYGPQIATFVYA